MQVYLRSNAKFHSISQGKHKLYITLIWIFPLPPSIKFLINDMVPGLSEIHLGVQVLSYTVFSHNFFKFWDQRFFFSLCAKLKHISQKGDNRKKYTPLKTFYNKTRSVILTMYTALHVVLSHIIVIKATQPAHFPCTNIKNANIFILNKNS